jgi:hypothetical protein
MAQPAVSAVDKLLMDRVRLEWMKIEMQTCNSCNERWFDLDVKDGKCDKCRKKQKYHASLRGRPYLTENIAIYFALAQELLRTQRRVVHPPPPYSYRQALNIEIFM